MSRACQTNQQTGREAGSELIYNHKMMWPRGQSRGQNTSVDATLLRTLWPDS